MAASGVRFDESFFREVLRLVPKTMLSYFSRNLVYLFVDGELLFELGLTPNDVEGKQVASYQTDGTVDRVRRACEDAIQGARMQFELEYKGRYLECHVAPHYEAEEIVGGILITRDITHRRRNEQQAAALARTDPLTGMANRNRLNQAARRATLSHDVIAFGMLDLNDFKQVNDTLGHSGGDACLKAVALALSSCTRAGDIVARLGGDEFALILRVPQKEDALAIAGRMRAAVAALTYGVTASIGLAYYPEQGTDPDALIELADAEMYREKKSR